MAKEGLLRKLLDIGWDDFERKVAQHKQPKDVSTTVSAFSNTSGEWIVFGIKQRGKAVWNTGSEQWEKMKSDFLNTLCNGQKFNMRLSAQG
ncbi:MAG: hypothetical protein KIC64_05650 [Prevotella buccae]|jgi:predicted HTH transcriptional regulator|uniref:AlbA family DNA-binding domain-containing protein n=1 Tax=Segatella buccae TaxID=28126 RepID=UPI0001C412B8|nr:RNA-binding domain-containing protein [Segatella buccae]EFC75762.1 hypothetical protein HMPREF0649_01194 [Segatella buccae D17]MBS5895293.1 hypothetical protein [Segatella buccae]